MMALLKTHIYVNANAFLNMKFVAILYQQEERFLEITAAASGLTACVSRSGLLLGEPILAGTWDRKKIMRSISQAWKTIVANEPGHAIIHPLVPNVAKWQDCNQRFATIMSPSQK